MSITELCLNDLLAKLGIDPKLVIVVRHRPHETELNKVLPWLAAERPEVFNAYQQTQGEILEKALRRLSGSGYLASFIGHEPGKALFVGLYEIGKTRPLSYSAYWNVPAYKEMSKYGMIGFKKADTQKKVLWFDLNYTSHYATWKGRLVIEWPGKERSWWRRSERNDFKVVSILEDNALVRNMPEWRNLNLKWQDLSVIPSSWKEALRHWRGVYYIFDSSDKKGYVGSASGKDNIVGRWQNYAESGDGGNRYLKNRSPENFEFSILERVSPDMTTEETRSLETSWKKRLHTRLSEGGLNDN